MLKKCVSERKEKFQHWHFLIPTVVHSGLKLSRAQPNHSDRGDILPAGNVQQARRKEFLWAQQEHVLKIKEMRPTKISKQKNNPEI